MAEVRTVAYGEEATRALRDAVEAAQGGDALAPVTVIVPSQLVGIAARRALAAQGGLAGVGFLTPLALAERLGAERAAALRHEPLTNAVLVAAVRVELREAPGLFAPVAQHAATELALARRYLELARCRPESLAAIARSGSTRARALVELVERVRHRLRHHLDEVTLLAAAREAVAAGDPAVAGLGRLIVHLPQPDAPGFVDLVAAVAGVVETRWIVGVTGDPVADAATVTSWRAAGIEPSPVRPGSDAPVLTGTEMISASDVDEEIRAVTRRVLELATAGIPFERMAILMPPIEPYARTVDAQLRAAGIAHNGPAIRRLADTVAGRAASRLVAMVDSAFARDEVIAFFAAVPLRRSDGASVPVDAWDRVSRRAGVVDGDDWSDRLAQYAAEMTARADDRAATGVGSDAEPRRAAAAARACSAFVAELRAEVAELAGATGWRVRAERIGSWLDTRLGAGTADSVMPEDEVHARDAVGTVLDRLAALDAVEPAPAPGAFARALSAELDSAAERVGHFGSGVLCAPVGTGVGMDLDAVFLVGLTEGCTPVTRREDALLGDADRQLAVDHELPTRDESLARQRHAYLAALAAGRRHRILAAPRGDLRTGRERMPSRYLLETASALAGRRVFGSEFPALGAEDGLATVASFASGVGEVDRAATAAERVLGLVSATPDRAPEAHPLLVGSATATGIGAQRSRESEGFTRWDGNVAAVAALVPSPATGEVVSPTRLQDWVECPMRYLLAHVLRVPAQETPERLLELSALDRGTLVHEALERFVAEELARPEPERVPVGRPWGPEHVERMRIIVEECTAAAEAKGLTGKATLWALHREEIEQDLFRFLVEDSRYRMADGAVPESVELPFGMDGQPPVAIELGDGRTVRFRGRADRVDVRPDGTRVVLDYKTGLQPGYARGLEHDPVKAGQRLQLPVYAAAARQLQGADRVEAAYWYVSDRGGWARDPFVLDAAADTRFREVVGHIVDGIDGGVFPAVPGEWSWYYGTGDQCAHCDYEALCTVDRIAQYERKETAPELAPLEALWPAADDEDGS